MRKDNSEFVTGFVSEAGTFVRNKDYFAYMELDDKACWVIADGLDSDREVESAELAIKSILGQFHEKPTMARFRLKRYMREANELLKTESRRVRLKASLTLIVTDYTRVRWVVAGNARLHHFKQGRLNFKSKDTSLTQQMLDGEQISEDWLDRHEERHNLLQYLGKPDEFEPFISKKYRLSDGDIMLLCTSGMWESVNSAEMSDAVEEAKDADSLVDTLEEVLLSKQQGVIKNYSAAAIYVNKIFAEDPQRIWKWVKKIGLLLLVMVLLGGGVLFFMIRDAQRKAELVTGMLEHKQNGQVFMDDGNYEKAMKEFSEGRNAAIKIKDRIHRELLGKKQRLAQLIVDGDKLVKDGDYAKALPMYNKAHKEAQSQKDFDINEINERIERTKSYMKVMDLVKEGDVRFEGEDYMGAKYSYQKARKAAMAASFDDGESKIKEKLDAVDEKLYGVHKGTKQLEAEKLEKKGDESMAAQDYTGAIDSFAQAQEIYQEIGMLERVLGMERKITKAVEKLEPVPPAGAAEGAGSAGASVAGTGANGGGTGASGGGGGTGDGASDGGSGARVDANGVASGSGAGTGAGVGAGSGPASNREAGATSGGSAEGSGRAGNGSANRADSHAANGNGAAKGQAGEGSEAKEPKGEGAVVKEKEPKGKGAVVKEKEPTGEGAAAKEKEPASEGAAVKEKSGAGVAVPKNTTEPSVPKDSGSNEAPIKETPAPSPTDGIPPTKVPEEQRKPKEPETKPEQPNP
ncbi:serine/threonine protein phosphatase [Paenibacillus sp. 481]|uniref:serine/threonine protein phosphatase n=1 Tax=Paenibacillus sp. 481 TaxID=2835869 RepID=UPI001E4C5B27|nr:serine/threonine protein phosphatase [Paenibacillus sp. 481]UHA72253.1 serine/threonine protein phosphatase [Paenibacillus sp. 481]